MASSKSTKTTFLLYWNPSPEQAGYEDSGVYICGAENGVVGNNGEIVQQTSVSVRVQCKYQTHYWNDSKQ